MVNKDVTPGRCLSCRSEVMVPNHFADGDIMQCAVCRMSLKIVRSSAAGTVRLVIADVTPLRDEMTSIELRVSGLESDLRRARASLGIGANGFGLGVLYVIAQVMLEDAALSRGLLLIAIAIACGIGLELANFFFLAKRREMSRLSAEIDEANSEIRQLQAKIRESVRK